MKRSYLFICFLACFFMLLFSMNGDFFVDSGQRLGDSVSYEVMLADLDGDGDLDAFVANRYLANKVWFNDGSGFFADSGQNLGNSDNRGLALGDLDGDGDQDAFVANLGGNNKVWLNNGNGFYNEGQNILYGNNNKVALGDLDGDGDLDAVIGRSIGDNRVLFNDGNADFADTGQILGYGSTHCVSLGDLDGDGDLDVFITNAREEPNKVWFNDGVGWFTDSGQSIGHYKSDCTSLGDLDGDGDLDAFEANRSQPNRVYFNNGNGFFTENVQSLGNSCSNCVCLGDLDKDGDLDAFIANHYDDPNTNPNKIWLNDGTGLFTDSGQDMGNSWSTSAALGDLDGDGDLDAFVANAYITDPPPWDVGVPNEVWINIYLKRVAIDIKPGSYPNSINLGSRGNVPVAIFSTDDFDATTVVPTTVTLAGAEVKVKGKGTPMASTEDVDGDGLLDLIVHVDTTALQLSYGDTEAVLEGETFDGQKIRGVDTIRIVQE